MSEQPTRDHVTSVTRRKHGNRSSSHRFTLAVTGNPAVAIGLAMVLSVLLIAVFAPQLAPHSPTSIQRAAGAFAPVGTEGFVLGTDENARDVLSRVIWGTRVSLLVAGAAAAIAIVIGTIGGVLTGYLGGSFDNLAMRLIDIALSFPSLLLIIVAVAIMGPGVVNATVVVGFVYAPRVVRIVRSKAIELRGAEYCVAATALGASRIRVMVRHILPNVTPTVLIYGSLVFAYGILAESGLSFLGLGAQPPTATWGTMLRTGRNFMEFSPGLAVFPGVAIAYSVLAFNLLGDGLRDLLDPRLRGAH